MSASAVDRREWPRIPASSLSDVRVSLVAGPDVKLVNLSRGGALLEVGARYAMRAFVRLKLTRTTGETTVVPGTVSWSRVGTIAAGRINYLVAVIFEQPIGDFAAVTGYQPDEREAAERPAEAVTPVAETCDPPEPVAARPAAVAIDESRLQLAAAEARAESLRHELDAATTDLANLTLTNDTLTAQLDAASLELRTLREELEGVQRRSADEQSRLAQAESQVAGEQSRLAEELAATAARAAALQAALDGRDEDHARALDDQRTRFDARLEELTRTIGAQHEDAAHLVAARERLEAERATLTEQMATALAAADALRAAVDAREQEHARLLHDERARLEARIQDLVDTVTRQQAEYAQLTTERESWEAERTATLAASAHAAAAAEALRAAAEAREQEHARALHEQQAHVGARIQELADTIRRQQAEYAQLTAEHERGNAERDTLLAQMADAVDAADSVRAVLDGREQAHARTLDEHRARFEAEVEELARTLSVQREDNARLVAERESWTAERARLLEHRAEAVAAADSVRAELEAQHEAHARELDEQRARFEARQQALARAADEQRAGFEARVQDLTDTITRQQAQYERLAAERESWNAELATLIEEMDGVVARADALQATLESREQEHARAAEDQQARFEIRVHELTEALRRREADCAQLAAERERWNDERSALMDQLADAVTRIDAVQRTLDAREQEHVQALAAEQARYEALIGELIQASNEQHTEFQHVLAEQTAAREEERARADRHEATLVRERAGAERERAELESRTRELGVRIEALEALCAAHETRYRTLRRDAEKLVSVLAAPVTAAAPHQDGVTSFPVQADTEHAVA